jgi:predicted metalloendopeptidase
LVPSPRSFTLHCYEFYFSAWNELLFPAGLLQDPVYDGDVTESVNYASTGTLLAYQLLKSIDEYGSYFTPEGKFKVWFEN